MGKQGKQHGTGMGMQHRKHVRNDVNTTTPYPTEGQVAPRPLQLYCIMLHANGGLRRPLIRMKHLAIAYADHRQSRQELRQLHDRLEECRWGELACSRSLPLAVIPSALLVFSSSLLS